MHNFSLIHIFHELFENPAYAWISKISAHQNNLTLYCHFHKRFEDPSYINHKTKTHVYMELTLHTERRNIINYKYNSTRLFDFFFKEYW